MSFRAWIRARVRAVRAQLPGLALLGLAGLSLPLAWAEVRGSLEDGRRHWSLWESGWVIREPGWVDGMAWLVAGVPPDEALAVADFGDPAQAAARSATRMKTAYMRLPEPVLSLSEAGWEQADWVLARWDLQGVMLRDRVFHDYRLVSGEGVVRLYQRVPQDAGRRAVGDFTGAFVSGVGEAAPGSVEYWRAITWQALRMALLLPLLGLAGWGWSRWICGGSEVGRLWLVRVPLALGVGFGGCSVLWWLGAVAGLGFSGWGWLLAPAVLAGTGWWLARRLVPKRRGASSDGIATGPPEEVSSSGGETVERGRWAGMAAGAVLAVMALLIFSSAVWLGMSRSLFCVPGMGIWGYKAKMLVLEGGLPEDYFTSASHGLSKPGYPPGLPLVLAKGYQLAGGVADHAVKVLNPALLALLFLWMSAWLHRVTGLCWWWAAALPLLFLLSGGARMFSQALYADLLLAALAIPALAMVAVAMPPRAFGSKAPRANRDRGAAVPKGSGGTLVAAGCVLAGVCAFVKNEGVVVWLVAGAVAWMGCGAKWGWFRWWLGAGLIWVVPWRLYVWLQGVSEADFDWGRPLREGGQELLATVTAVLERWWQLGWTPGSARFASAWPAMGLLLLLGLVVALWNRFKDSRMGSLGTDWIHGGIGRREVLRLALAALLTAAGVHGVYVFSAIDLSWHMLAMERTDLAPAGVALLAAAGLAAHLSRRAGGARWFVRPEASAQMFGDENNNNTRDETGYQAHTT